MPKANILLGDKLTSGGSVISATSTVKINGVVAARLNDIVSCPLEGHGINRIVGGEPGFTSEKIELAFDNALCACGCRVIASTTESILG
ncbi:PAAR domain-containing protein [Scandinavium sp. M-37]|uniref:PAAR domain-containing protein n=1 Tax=Scandinavium sp. M-37 TaxID=3373077 RepID=UPI0037465CB1